MGSLAYRKEQQNRLKPAGPEKMEFRNFRCVD
jgi:hypothetical protein